jgi:hypothetical protein
MRRNIWTTPFGLAFMIGSAFALVAGYAYGRNFVSVAVTDLNVAEGYDNMSAPTDENLLIEANREPAASEPIRPREDERPAQATDRQEREAEVVDVPIAEPDRPAEADEPAINESEQDQGAFRSKR